LPANFVLKAENLAAVADVTDVAVIDSSAEGRRRIVKHIKLKLVCQSIGRRRRWQPAKKKCRSEKKFVDPVRFHYID
jgi:hypothetical protein